jgi:hypothetical protein
MKKSQKILATVATLTMLLATGTVQGNNILNFKKLFKLETDAEAPTL